MFLRKRNSPRKSSSEMDSGWRLKKRLQPPAAPKRKQRFAKTKQPRRAALVPWDDDPWLEKGPTVGEPGKISTSSSEDEYSLWSSSCRHCSRANVSCSRAPCLTYSTVCLPVAVE